MTRCKRIRVPSEWRDGSELRREIAEFGVGPGPCGKDVMTLSASVSDGFLEINQCCTDGSSKVFLYPAHTITGRIEAEPA